MRGITPVIAIILLLLMAVAAAGGFYFVYQGFTESGEESGSTQIEQLGEQSLAAIQIESAAGGRIYVKNVGASDIDLSKVSVYVENVPYSVNTSSDTLAERNRAVLKFTQRPSCSSDSCEVKISGAVSASKSVDISKLSCSSDAECYSSETCEGGVCVESEEEEEEEPCEWYSGPGCGDCECGAGENGESCFLDCAPRSLLLPIGWLEGGQPALDVHTFSWNGSTYEKGENVTQDELVYMLKDYEIDSGGNALSAGTVAQFSGGDAEVWFSHNSSGAWSAVDNITQANGWEDNYVDVDFNSTDEALAVWRAGDGVEENLAWASFDGTAWSMPQNLTAEGEVSITDTAEPSFSFAPDDKGMLVWGSSSDPDDWLNYSLWDGGWVEEGTVADEVAYYNPVVASNSTHFLAAWRAYYSGTGDEVIQWSTWDISAGGPWGPVQNVSDEPSDLYRVLLEKNSGGDWLLVVTNETSRPRWPEWYSWQNGWVHEGNLTGDPMGIPTEIVKSEKDALILFLDVGEVGISTFTYWDGDSWQETVELDGYVFWSG